MVAQLNCAQRPEDPGGLTGPVDPTGLQAAVEALFWEGKCQALLRELEAAHEVSQVMLREYNRTLQDKSLETADWQERFVRTLSELNRLEVDRSQCHEEKQAVLKRLHASEESVQRLQSDLQREVARRREGAQKLKAQLADSGRETQRWKDRAERAARDLQDTQERARAAFSNLIAKNSQLLEQCEQLQRRPDTRDQGVLCKSSQTETGTQCTASREDKQSGTQGHLTQVDKETNTMDGGAIATPPPTPNPNDARPERPQHQVCEADTLMARPQWGAGDGIEDLLGIGLPPPSPVEAAGESLLDVSVDRLDELLRPAVQRCHQEAGDLSHDQQEGEREHLDAPQAVHEGNRSQENAAERDPGGVRDELEGMLCAVRAQLLRAIQSSQQRQRQEAGVRGGSAEQQVHGDVPHEACGDKNQPDSHGAPPRDDSEGPTESYASPDGCNQRLSSFWMDTTSEGSVTRDYLIHDSCHWPPSYKPGVQHAEALHGTSHSPAPHALDDETPMDTSLNEIGTEQAVAITTAEVGVQVTHTADRTEEYRRNLQATSQTEAKAVACAFTQTEQPIAWETARLRETLVRERQALAALTGTLRLNCCSLPRRPVVKRLQQPLRRKRKPAAKTPSRTCPWWHPAAWRRLRLRMRGHIWQRAALEGAATPVSPGPPPVESQVALVRRHLQRTAHLRVALRATSRTLAASQQDRLRAQQHNQFLQHRLQHLIHCSAVTASDLAAMRSVLAKLTGQLPDLGDLGNMLPDQVQKGPVEEKLLHETKPISPRGKPQNEVEVASKTEDGMEPDRGCDSFPVKLDRDDNSKKLDRDMDRQERSREPKPHPLGPVSIPDRKLQRASVARRLEEDRLWDYVQQVDTTVRRVIRGLRGLPVAPTCLVLLRAVPRLARQLVTERKRTSLSLPQDWNHDAEERESIARLRNMSLAHKQQLADLRKHHHKYIQALRETHTQAVGRLIEQHAVELCRAKEAVRADLRAELRRDLQRDMRSVLARSTAMLEQLHQAELTSLLGRAVANVGQRAHKIGHNADVQTKGSGDFTELNNKLHEAGVIAQAATLALEALRSVHTATQDSESQKLSLIENPNPGD